jgi:hypothetical protein
MCDTASPAARCAVGLKRKEPGDNVDLMARRLVKRQKLAEAPATGWQMPRMGIA